MQCRLIAEGNHFDPSHKGTIALGNIKILLLFHILFTSRPLLRSFVIDRDVQASKLHLSVSAIVWRENVTRNVVLISPSQGFIPFLRQTVSGGSLNNAGENLTAMLAWSMAAKMWPVG